MTPLDLLDLFRAGDFHPFVVHLTNGAEYEVRHPDQAMIHGETLHISTQDGIQRCSILNIASVTTDIPA
ncbi:hypothetical protein [Botrimarina sp.]|uniref:hypothetical protein n=1 Tax=Botrimarina sp. TaxID=2795802 RepID=UPI0032EF2149